MGKLPASDFAKLKAGLSGGTIPDPGGAGYSDVFDIWDDLGISLFDEWSEPGASKARREVSALVQYWSAVPFGGLVVGVAINQPGVVAAAIAAAESMNLPAVARALKEVVKHIPDHVSAMADVDERLAWYQSEHGTEHAAQLAALEDAVQNEEVINELLLGCFRRALAEPAEFFEAR